MQEGLIPNVSVDCVVFGFDFTNLNVLLIERNVTVDGIKYADLKLPGDLMSLDEDLDASAARILKENTGLSDIYLKQFKSFGSPNRLKKKPRDMEWLREIDHPAEQVVTIAYYSLIDISEHGTSKITISDNSNWYPVLEVTDLVMDHMDILTSALEHLRVELLNKPIGFELLPDKFTLSQMQKLYEVILGTTFDKRNFRKKISSMKYLIPLNEKQVGVAHKPARLYIFSREVYTKTRKDNFDFSV
jgi:ADP-ribose pyrophosphatase YjhB (NUDIX family)